MSDNKSPDGWKALLRFETRDIIYGVVLVIGCGLIVSGINDGFKWRLSDEIVIAIGAVFGVAGTFLLSWLRKK